MTNLTTHFSNFGVSCQPRCADGAGFIHYREDFYDLDPMEWTESEQFVAVFVAVCEDRIATYRLTSVDSDGLATYTDERRSPGFKLP
jgi:hypothetical protein